MSCGQGGERNEQWRKSFAQATRGNEQQGMQEINEIIQIQPAGYGWLYRSAAGEMRRLISTNDLKAALKKEKVENEEVKEIRGRFIIITFSNVEARDEVVRQKWLLEWFDEVKPWNGEQARDERFVWLACFGMPPSAWCVPTFEEIGSRWGQLIDVDEITLREESYAKGRILIATKQSMKIEENIQLILRGRRFVI